MELFVKEYITYFIDNHEDKLLVHQEIGIKNLVKREEPIILSETPTQTQSETFNKTHFFT